MRSGSSQAVVWRAGAHHLDARALRRGRGRLRGTFRCGALRRQEVVPDLHILRLGHRRRLVFQGRRQCLRFRKPKRLGARRALLRLGHGRC